MALARRSRLRLLEDVAQAVGGRFNGESHGSIGDVGAFSFQFNKIITCRDGGIANIEDTEIYRRGSMWHDGGAAQDTRFRKNKL